METFLNSEVFSAFADASDSVYIFANDLRINMSRWSKRAVDYFDLPDEYMLEADKYWLARIHPEDREMVADELSEVLSGNKNVHLARYRALNKYNEYIWVECNGRIVYDENGRATVFAGMISRLDAPNKFDILTGFMTYYEFFGESFFHRFGIAMFISVDDTNKVITNYGYSYCKDILMTLADNMRKLCREEDRIYRFNSGEFVVLIPDGEEEYAVTLFEKIKSIAAKLKVSDESSVALSISAGVAHYDLDIDSKNDIINRVQFSLDYARRNKKGSMQFFSDDIESTQKRIELIRREIRSSIEDDFNGFEILYQPWVDRVDGRIKGCEALLRWKGDTVKDSNPDEFIPILEENGDIIPVGYWVMRNTMRQQKIWNERFGELLISVNVSYQQFLHEGFALRALQYCKDYSINPTSIIMELTESSAVKNPAALSSVFNLLRLNGFRIALDDFGTAYSSMHLLKNLPADIIKIEHSFVRELSSQGHEIDFAIIESILMLCQKIGCLSIVEGVENQEVDSIIRAMDVGFLQGYYYSRPVSREEFENMLILQK